MSARWVDMQARKDRVLSIVIEQYIKTVSPVSSNYITKQFFEGLSSATIRNILAELEQEGYLTHPHTSAGRVPTQKGYRYYVDNLMNEIQLLEEEKERIKAEYERESMELEALLEKTSRVLAETTHYTSIVSVEGWQNKLFCQGTSFVVNYPDYNDIKKIAQILNALDEKQRLLEVINQDLVNKLEIFIGSEIACSDINSSCSLVVSRYEPKRGPKGRIAVLGPTRMDYERVVSTLNYLSELLERIL